MATTGVPLLLRKVFDPRANALNAIRLTLAASVVLIHSFALSGHPLTWRPAHDLLSDIGVDGFFAISGFLIVASWMRQPDWQRFLRSRLTRIMPAFWVCLIVTAAVFAPLSVVISGTQVPSWGTSNLRYVAANSLLWGFQPGIDGTLRDVPFPVIWNLPLWTLPWEFLCYLGVLLAGLTGLLKQRVLGVVVGLCWLGLLGESLVGIDVGVVHHACRFGLMFGCGALIYLLQDAIRVSWSRLALAGAVILASAFLPDYQLVAAPFGAYVCIGLGAMIKAPRLRLRNDISYGLYIYAFPVQQLLATAGLSVAGTAVFAAASVLLTLPLAVASWFIVEKPILSRVRARPSPVRSR